VNRLSYRPKRCKALKTLLTIPRNAHSVSIPRQSQVWGRSKRPWGRYFWPPNGGLRAICSFGRAGYPRPPACGVFPDHRFVSTNGRDEVSPSSEVLPYEVFACSLHRPGPGGLRSCVDVPDHLQHRTFG
jgi:hypothetical protein